MRSSASASPRGDAGSAREEGWAYGVGTQARLVAPRTMPWVIYAPGPDRQDRRVDQGDPRRHPRLPDQRGRDAGRTRTDDQQSDPPAARRVETSGDLISADGAATTAAPSGDYYATAAGRYRAMTAASSTRPRARRSTLEDAVGGGRRRQAGAAAARGARFAGGERRPVAPGQRPCRVKDRRRSRDQRRTAVCLPNLGNRRFRPQRSAHVKAGDPDEAD